MEKEGERDGKGGKEKKKLPVTVMRC